MTAPTDALPLVWLYATADIPERGLKCQRKATEEERAALAEALGIVACEALEATFQVTPMAGGSYRLEGGLDAAVTQACVISLEPVPGRVAERFSVEFRHEVEEEAPEGESGILDAAEIEPIENDAIDAGRVVYETLSAGLDPYPRKEGAEFGWTDPKAEKSASHPFAVLKQLKDRD